MVDDDSPMHRCGELSSSTCSSPQSPHAMAEAAVATAMLAEDERNAVDEKRRRSSTEETLHKRKRQSYGYNSGSSKGPTVSHTSNDCRAQECSSSTGSSTSYIGAVQVENEGFCMNKPSNVLSLVNSTEGKCASSRYNDVEEEEHEDDLTLTKQVWDEFTQEYFLNGDGCTTKEEAKEAMLEAVNDFIIGKAIDTLMQDGIEAFNELEIITGDAMTLNRMLDSRQRELNRLRDLESGSRTSLAVRNSFYILFRTYYNILIFLCICAFLFMLPLQNLLCEVKASNNSIQASSNAAQVESHLAKELQIALSERDKTMESCMELTKKNSLLEEELSLVKGKLHRLMQDKMKVERDSRAAISLARSLDMRTSSDAEFYKRKVR